MTEEQIREVLNEYEGYGYSLEYQEYEWDEDVEIFGTKRVDIYISYEDQHNGKQTMYIQDYPESMGFYPYMSISGKYIDFGDILNFARIFDAYCKEKDFQYLENI